MEGSRRVKKKGITDRGAGAAVHGADLQLISFCNFPLAPRNQFPNTLEIHNIIHLSSQSQNSRGLPI